MNRKERRALAHKERKLARKLANQATNNPQGAAPSEPIAILDIPEPGGVFPSLASITPEAPKPPISDAQLAANRENAKRSTGPRSETGRAISSQNRTTHGLARHNGEFRLLSSEDSNGFEALKASLAQEHQPETETEAILVNTMAESHWLANRAQKLQETCSDPDTGQVKDAALAGLYLRYHTTHTRVFHKALNDLLKLRKEKRTEQNGFEAQKRKDEELRIQSEKHEMKKQGHYWDLLFKDAKTCNQLAANIAQQGQARMADPTFEAKFAAGLAQHGLNKDAWGAAKAA